MATVVVTGANRGIGLELVRQLVARGDAVIGACRRSSRELDESGAEVVTGVDVTSDEGVSKLVTAVGDRLLDVVVHNAGILEHGPSDAVSGFDFASIRRQMEVNAYGPLRVTAALVRHVPHGGKLIFVSSRAGSIGDNASGGLYGYRMSKAALNMAAKSLARDLADRGIAVGVLHPGFVRTEMTGGNGNVDAREAAAGLIARIDALGPQTSGTFWHASGEILPW
jgi:NAD(P)-dependent dehydrogenase (short-subunit alcohol dehydrogenase family)